MGDHREAHERGLGSSWPGCPFRRMCQEDRGKAAQFVNLTGGWVPPAGGHSQSHTPLVVTLLLAAKLRIQMESNTNLQQTALVKQRNCFSIAGVWGERPRALCHFSKTQFENHLLCFHLKKTKRQYSLTDKTEAPSAPLLSTPPSQRQCQA